MAQLDVKNHTPPSIAIIVRSQIEEAMRLNLKRSIRVGPLRFHLSQSGIGISSGIKYPRFGAHPRSTYVHMGTRGLYYRRALRPKSKKTEVNRSLTGERSGTVGLAEQTDDGCIAQMIDTSSAQVLHELNQKRNQIMLWPFAAGALGVSFFALLFIGTTFTLSLLLLILGAVAVSIVYLQDLMRKSVVIMYDLDEPLCDSADSVHQALAILSRCGATWRLASQDQVNDSKYHAGAGALVRRQKIQITISEPPNVRTNVSVYCVSWPERSLYFLPDRVLVYEGHHVGAISYQELQFEINTTRFIEEERLPHDAKVVDQTWRYVNKNGTPDRRFNSNRKIPVCLYEVLNLQSSSGLNEIFHLSQTGVSSTLDAAVADLSQAIQVSLKAESERQRVEDEKRRLTPPELPIGKQIETTNTTPQFQAVVSQAESCEQAIVHVLCCVMVADGKASRSERIYIHKQMRRFKIDWEPSRIDAEIDQFIACIRESGGKLVLDQTISNLPLIKKSGKAAILVDSLVGLIEADSHSDERELALCKRLAVLLTK